jgi:hypothetical protein
MAAVECDQIEELSGVTSRPVLRLVRVEGTPRATHVGAPLAQRRAARARMLRRRRRTVVALVLLAGLAILSLQNVAFGGVPSAGLSNDLSSNSVLAPGMAFVVQPGDTLHSIAVMIDPSDPATARAALVRELGSTVVVPGEHVLIP